MSHTPRQDTGVDRFRLAMDASGVGMAIVDLHGRWLEVNPAFERMFGYSAHDVIGTPASSLTHPDDVAMSRHFLRGLVDGSIPVLDAQKRYVRRDGETIWAQVNVSVMRDEHAQPLFLLVQLRDISAQHAAELALKSRADAEYAGRYAANHQLQLFADAVAHDLRAPLRSIESFSALLADRAGERLDETDRDYLTRIRAAASRMSGLLSALNELSYVTRTELKAADVDLSLLADWVGAELQDAEPRRRAEIQVQPSLHAWGDERLLKLLLTQLMDNAWKFSREREPIRIRVSGRDDGDMLHVEIRDEGIGFDMRYAHKLFEPFQRLHGPDQGGGHGLGLAIVRRIAERHGGSVRADSRPESGATFTLELPARAVAEENA
ncbi:MULTISPECIES: ATP-binding protein [unclassified Lysobacter]|uniref:sensor histidine kinase n=1 Tax=unclassified Lysobacter TaxID=2635362 RepID=UPI001C226EE0|nr:ATP-binding protein [Lysobacter sp. MMG2]MBU8977158.1 PAS domain S-box protein [Lysobacter sp. MMG2]